MAKIQLTAFLNQIRGSVFGTTFSKNHNGIYVKSKPNPINPNTPAQQEVRGQLAAVSRLWQTLTDGQRAQWKEKAASEWPYQDNLGETKHYAGNQLFNKLNQQLITIGQSTITDAVSPVDLPYQPVATFDVLVDGSGVLTEVKCTFAVSPIAEGQTLVLNSSASVSLGVDPVSFKRKKSFQTTTGGLSFDFTSEYAAIFGNPEPGKAVWVFPYIVDNFTGTRLDIAGLKAVVAQSA